MKALLRTSLLSLALACVSPNASSTAAASSATPPEESPSEAAHDRPGGVVARTDEELASMLARQDGPAIIDLLRRTYRGPLVIKRPVTLHGVKGTTISGEGHGTVITVDAEDVTIENLTIRDSGHRHTAEDAGIKARGERVHIADVRIVETLFGASLQECKHCVVERVQVQGWGDDLELRGDGIKLWESNDSIVRHCKVDRSRDMVVWYTRRATLEDNVVTRSRYGTHFMYAHDSVVRRSRFEGDVVGIFVMYSARLELEDNVLAGARGAAGVGLGFKDSDAIEAKRNWLVANTTGVYFDNTPRTPTEVVRFDDNLVALNDVSIRLHSAEKGLALHGNDIHQNAVVIEVDGGGDALSADVRGNHFSDYEGYDLDHDGVGDVAYEVKALSSELSDSRPAVKLFSGTAAMGVIDAVARAVPVLSSKNLLVDAAPLASRPTLTTPRTP